MLEAGVEVCLFAKGDNGREVGGVDVGIHSEEPTEDVVDHSFEVRREFDAFFLKIKGASMSYGTSRRICHGVCCCRFASLVEGNIFFFFFLAFLPILLGKMASLSNWDWTQLIRWST